jgi:NADH-quinone oxidoreductase subunit E
MAESVPVVTQLSPELSAYIDQWKDKPGNLIMILHRVQEEYRFIPRDVAFTISRLLDVPLAKIYGVVSFYHFFKLNPPGKHIIAMCMGTACYLKGGEDIVKELEVLVGVGIGGTTADREFSVDAVRCIGCCGLAPVLTIDGEVYGQVTKDQLPKILAKYQKN